MELSNGTCIAADEVKGYLATIPPGGEPVTVERERVSSIPRVKWALINALEILEGNDDQTDGRILPGSTIPVRPMFGEVLNVNGKRTMRGIVRAAKDPARMYNYNNSALVEDVALAPKSPIMGAVGQFETALDQWNQANQRNYPFLEYDPVAVGGEPMPPPSRPPGPDPAKIQALVVSIQQNKSDLRTTTGWYDSTDPTRANSDQSGKAIAARKLQQEQTGLAFQDNYRQTLVSLGKLLLEWIPVIYDRPGRIIQTLGLEEGAQPEWAMIGQPFIRGANGQPIPAGQQLTHPTPEAPAITYDPAKGIYGVRVTIGASHETRRQEAAALEIKLRNEPGFAHLFQSKIKHLHCRLQPRRRGGLARSGAVRRPRIGVEPQLPAVPGGVREQRAAEALAALQRCLQRQRNTLTRKAHEVGRLLQRPV